jgi:hypothetical protein
MQISAALCLTLAFAQPTALFAEQPRPSVRSRAITRAIAQPVFRDIRARLATRQQQRPMPDPNWISRHPVLVGALTGAAGGALIGGTVVHPCVEESFCRRAGLMQIGTAAGAGVGALAGLVVAWIR